MIRSRLIPIAVALAAGALLAGCGRPLPTAADLGGGASSASAVAALSPTTTPPTKDWNKPVVWALYRMVDTLNPIQAFDYPENTVDTALCDSLLRQEPDGTIVSGVATATYPTPTKLVLNLRTGPRFWDGHPVTSADVLFDLERAASTKDGSFYPQVFDRVKSMSAPNPTTVVVTLKEPDYWLEGELSQMAGIVYEKSYALREGKQFGTPQGLTMCTGPYEPKKWIPGESLTAVANPHYWDSTLQPKVHELIFKGIGQDATLTSGLETGAVNGTYAQGIATYNQLKRDKSLSVIDGPAANVDAMVIDNLKGVLGDVRVRQAISDAINREALIAAVYHGASQMPRTLESPGQWGYGQPVFEKDWAHLPPMTVNLDKAKALIRAAHATGKSIVIGTTQQISSLATDANVVRQAAVEIGLKVTIKSVSAQDYIALFTSAAARKGIDMFPTSNYGDYADPAALYNTVVMPGGSQNYDNWDNPAMVRDLNLARSTANPDLRASYVAKVGDMIATQLPWIPLDDPDTVLIESHYLTGAPVSFVYMGGPWANMMGAR
ncbi:MAG TPA: ABC transporter substrate-binding protein [Solirubrobacteraceae bacterium]|nr:ABC transporter substrate-binding protein [Solirubrobacteraceae bacterium]